MASKLRKPKVRPTQAALAAKRAAKIAALPKHAAPVVRKLPAIDPEAAAFISEAKSEAVVFLAEFLPETTMVKKPAPHQPVAAVVDHPRWASAMAAGHPGGAYSMNLWDAAGLYDNESGAANLAYQNARDPGELPYVYNTNLWCSSLIPQLSCLVVQKDECAGGAAAGTAWRSRAGGVAITPQHILYCEHLHPWARDTWPVFPSGCIADTRLRLVGNDVLTVDRVQAHQAYNSATYGDICVAVLATPLPASIFIPKILPYNGYDQDLWEKVALSQEWLPDAGPQQPSSSASDYPLHNRNMLHACGAVYNVSTTPNDAHIRQFIYNVWPGDSGTPHFIVYQGELILTGLIGADSFSTVGGASAEARINALIAAADANAIALGRIAGPTGYTVSVHAPIL